MSLEQGSPKFEKWADALQHKAKLLHAQIASLEKWVQEAGGNEELLETLAAP